MAFHFRTNSWCVQSGGGGLEERLLPAVKLCRLDAEFLTQVGNRRLLDTEWRPERLDLVSGFKCLRCLTMLSSLTVYTSSHIKKSISSAGGTNPYCGFVLRAVRNFRYSVSSRAAGIPNRILSGLTS